MVLRALIPLVYIIVSRDPIYLFRKLFKLSELNPNLNYDCGGYEYRLYCAVSTRSVTIPKIPFETV